MSSTGRLLWFVALWLAAALAPGGAAAQSRPVRSLDVFQGEIVQIHVPGEDFFRIEGRLGETPIWFYPHGSEFSALLGIDVEAKTGPTQLRIKAIGPSETSRESVIVLRIRPKSFPQESLAVAPRFEPFSRETMERIRREQDQFARVFADSSPVRLWEGAFVKPVAGDVTSPFGLRRIINGSPRAPHSGTDLRAPEGTDVVAANHGRVALRGEFFFSGKSLVLDHGGGLFTMYFHLSEFVVAQDEMVRKGEPIGRSGMTGRVTGPHLHWAARLNQARVDPLGLIGEIRRPAGGVVRRGGRKQGGGP